MMMNRELTNKLGIGDSYVKQPEGTYCNCQTRSKYSRHPPCSIIFRAFPQVCCCAIQDAFEDTLVLPPIIVGTINVMDLEGNLQGTIVFTPFFFGKFTLTLGVKTISSIYLVLGVKTFGANIEST